MKISMIEEFSRWNISGKKQKQSGKNKKVKSKK